MRIGLVAQWIEQLRPKEKVVRSTRTRVTISINRRPLRGCIFLFRMGRNLNSYFLIIIDMRNSFLRNNKKKLAVVAVGGSIGRCCYSHFCGTIFCAK